MKQKLLAFVPTTLAREIENPALSEKAQGLSGIGFINNFLSNIITVFFIIGTVAAIVYFAWNGVRFISAQGNKETATKAQEGMTAAIIGLVVLFSLYAVLRLLERIFGVKILSIDITPLILE